VTVVHLSEHVQRAVEEEREVVAARLAELRAQYARLQGLAEQIDSDIDETARVLRGMDEMLGRAPQLSLDALHGELRGKRLREIAVQLLRETRGDGAVIHYREWFDLVLEAGGKVAGRDPLATFLTQIARAPDVISERPRSGLYRLSAAS
jgi:hypothetical protein